MDSHNFPNLSLMKLSAYHKDSGDSVEWWYALEQYDRVYMSKVFDNTYSPDIPEPMNAKEIIKGGTGANRRGGTSEYAREVMAEAERMKTDVLT